jgi:hypothetical protein
MRVMVSRMAYGRLRLAHLCLGIQRLRGVMFAIHFLPRSGISLSQCPTILEITYALCGFPPFQVTFTYTDENTTRKSTNLETLVLLTPPLARLNLGNVARPK